jgi:hypothetical protein
VEQVALAYLHLSLVQALEGQAAAGVGLVPLVVQHQAVELGLGVGLQVVERQTLGVVGVVLIFPVRLAQAAPA